MRLRGSAYPVHGPQGVHYGLVPIGIIAMLVSASTVTAPVALATGLPSLPVGSDDRREETVARSPFPSADDVSAIVGVEMQTDGIYEGLGLDWRGLVLDGDAAIDAWTQRYLTPEETLPEGQVLVVVDLIRFESLEDAVRRVDEAVFADDAQGFDTGLSADWEVSSSHAEEDGRSVASIFVREGPEVLAVSTFRWDTTAPEPTTVAIAGFALDRLAGLGEWVIVLAPGAGAPPSPAVAPGARDRFPSAEEVSEVLGVDVGIRGIEPGLSQLWEGMDSDWQELPSAMLGLYWAPPYETDEPLAGVTIDVAEFPTVYDAMRHADESFNDWPAGFETDLRGDYVFSHTFESDEDVDGSFIVVRDGLVVVVVMVFRSDGTEAESASEAIAGLVLGKLHADT